jgi:hypothetical protein
MFSGFTIKSNAIPPFWRFVYWSNPYHYTLEGIIVTQFHNAEDLITLSNGHQMTLGALVEQSFPDWRYDHVWYDIMVLVLVVVSTACLRYYSLSRFRFEKR